MVSIIRMVRMVGTIRKRLKVRRMTEITVVIAIATLSAVVGSECTFESLFLIAITLTLDPTYPSSSPLTPIPTLTNDRRLTPNHCHPTLLYSPVPFALALHPRSYLIRYFVRCHGVTAPLLFLDPKTVRAF